MPQTNVQLRADDNAARVTGGDDSISQSTLLNYAATEQQE